MNDFCVYIETTYCLNNKKITTVDCMIPSPMYLLPKHVREKAINMYKFFNHKLNQLQLCLDGQFLLSISQ